LIESESFIAIAGCGRSGTTLAVDLIGCHPEISPVYETDFVITVAGILFAETPAPMAEQVAQITALMSKWSENLPKRPHNKRDYEKYLHGPHYIVFSRDFVLATTVQFTQALMQPNPNTAALFHHFVMTLFREHARQDHKPKWVNKTPTYMFSLPAFKILFPGFRLIHCIRDPRDVARSILAVPWGPKTFAEGLDYWLRNIHCGQAFQQQYPDDYLEVHYENIIRSPQRELDRIFAWLGESEVGDTVVAECLARGLIFDDTHVAKWRGKLSAEETALVSAKLQPQLRAFDYPLE
tara:strand:+ start:59115 stop:59996 length:882 start_codon:yes stop_codon:yes gene_type:complete